MSKYQALIDALAGVNGQLGQPSLHSGHVIYAETEEWCSVDINVKLSANKHISGPLARFIKEAANPATIRALLADLDAMRGALERIAADGWKKGYTFCHPEGCESPGIARAALSEAKAGGWVSPYDSVPQPDQTALVWSRQTWETSPSLKIDTWAMQREAPLSFSTATIETGYGWDDHEDFESVIAWQPLPAPPSQKEPT